MQSLTHKFAALGWNKTCADFQNLSMQVDRWGFKSEFLETSNQSASFQSWQSQRASAAGLLVKNHRRRRGRGRYFNPSCCLKDQCGCCNRISLIKTGWHFSIKRRTKKCHWIWLKNVSNRGKTGKAKEILSAVPSLRRCSLCAEWI